MVDATRTTRKTDVALMFCQSRPVFQDTITPGDWRCIEPKNVAEEDQTYWQISGGSGYFDDEKRHGFCVTGYINKADARLIAAAPKLLNALENLFAMVQGECPSLLRDDHHYEMVTDAIAKATGKP